jgi:hypothetical protein
MTSPHGFDINESSCVKKEIQVYNCKRKKMMQLMKHSVIVETTVTRSDSTKHGFHLNMNGKKKNGSSDKRKDRANK